MVQCDAGIVVATGTEAGGLSDRLEQSTVVRGKSTIRCGLMAGRNVAIAVSGIGTSCASRALQTLVAGHRPRIVLSVGFAGALCDRVRRGDWVVVEQVVDDRQGGTVDLSLCSPMPIPRSGQLHVGRLLTADHLIATPEEKAVLGRQYAALAVDMETWAIARQCAEMRLPCFGIRLISDDVNEALPAEIERVARQPNATRRLGAAVGVLMRRPSRLRDFLRLRLDGVALSAELAAFVEQLVVRLIPERIAGERA